MNNKTPYFTYNLYNPARRSFGSIEMNGEVVHKIDCVERFYEVFGYTREVNKAGVLPEEFIWAEYVSKGDPSLMVCIQIKILDYLKTNSRQFLHKHGDRCDEWLASLERDCGCEGIACIDCKARS